MNRREAEEYLYCAMSIGEQLLVSGAEVGRVEDTIRRICLAYGAERADVFSITSSIVTTIYGADFGACTQTRRVSGMVNDLDRVDQLNQLSREICQEKPTHEEIKEKLTQIQNRPHYSFGMQLLIYALVSGSFSVFFGGDLRDMIASALICKPDLLIADEPTTALDVTIQAQILEVMKNIQKKNHMGIIFITHNLGVVAEICDKVSVMYAGKMVEQGPVDDIFYAPGHPYTRGLLRSMPRVDADSYERLIPIEGTPVDMLNPPEGCPFAPRCESAMKICLQKMPPYVELGDNHRAACWLCVQDQIKAQKAAEKNNEKTEAGSHE